MDVQAIRQQCTR